MKTRNIFLVYRRYLRIAFRSQVFIWLLLMPFLLTFILQTVLKSLLAPVPVLGIAAAGPSLLADSLACEQGMVTKLYSGEELESALLTGEVDAGLFLRTGFEDSLSAGLKPRLDFRFSQSGSPVAGGMLFLLIMDRARSMSSITSTASFNVVTSSGRSLFSIDLVLLPVLVILVVIIIGVFSTSYFLTEERESGTMIALLQTPVTPGEVVASAMAAGFTFAVPSGLVMLLLNSPGGVVSPAVIPFLLSGTAMCCVTGAFFGLMAASVKSLYTLIKSMNLLLVAPVAVMFLPGIPGWLPWLFPTYWFIEPLQRIIIHGAGLSDTAMQLLICTGLTMVLAGLLALPVKTMKEKLAGG